MSLSKPKKESMQCARSPEPYEYLPTDYFKEHTPSCFFHDASPLEIDLGCGDGSFLTCMAKHYPERHFLGVERLLGRVRHTSKKIGALGLQNVKLLRLESLYTLQYFLAPESVSRLHLLFADPWPKARHHRRRLFSPPFLNALDRVLLMRGECLFATDDEDYYLWALDVVSQWNTHAKLTCIPWQEGDFFYPKTDFQRQWEAMGKKTFYLRLQKNYPL